MATSSILKASVRMLAGSLSSDDAGLVWLRIMALTISVASVKFFVAIRLLARL